MPIDLDISCANKRYMRLQERQSSSKTSRKRVSETCQFNASHLMEMSKSQQILFFFVLGFKGKVYSRQTRQAESLLSSPFKILFKGTGSFTEINKLASSANKIYSRREASPRSLTYMMKNRGPRIEPRGTPQRITSDSDLWPLYSTN